MNFYTFLMHPSDTHRAIHAEVAQHLKEWRHGAQVRNSERGPRMTDLSTVLTALRRPKILIRAARAGVTDYRRDRDLKRLCRPFRVTAPQHAIATLLDEEQRLEATRAAGDATYSIQRHVAVLTALLAEARLRPATASA
jgi:hypothetical protein